MNNFTPEDLIQYLYKETDAEKTFKIEQALKTDWTLNEKLKVLKAAQGHLNKLQLSPRAEAVLSILHYASHKPVQIVNN